MFEARGAEKSMYDALLLVVRHNVFSRREDACGQGKLTLRIEIQRKGQISSMPGGHEGRLCPVRTDPSASHAAGPAPRSRLAVRRPN